MAMKVRFHLDESAHGAVADGLRRRGIDVTVSAEVGPLGASDEQQFSYSRADGRVLITCDAGFLRLAARGVPHCVYCLARARTIGDIIRGAERLGLEIDPTEWEDRVAFV